MPNNDTPSQKNQSSGTGKIKGKVHGFVSGSSPLTTQPFSGQGHRLGGEQKTPQESREARLKRFEPKASTENTGQATLPRAAGFAPEFTEKLNTLMQKKIDAQNKSVAKPVVTAKAKPASPAKVEKPKASSAKTQEQSRFSKMAAQFKDFFSKKPPSAEQQIKEYRQKQATKFATQQKAEVVGVAAESTGLFPQIASWVKEALSYLAQKKNNEGNTQTAHVSAQNDVKFVTTEEDVATLLAQFEDLPNKYNASELEQTMPTTPSTPEENQLQTLIILFIQIMMALKVMMQQQQQQMHQNGQGMQINPLTVLSYCSQLMGMQLGQPLQQGAGPTNTNINIVVGSNNKLVLGQGNNNSTSGSSQSGVNVNLVAGDNNQSIVSQRNGSDFGFGRNDTSAAESKHGLDREPHRHLPRNRQ